ncbi:hypothetical protein [Nocardia pseudovaccinii]|uniref:hypothetical protein n=1 Tax=Nocardia pseudovaccinii TaxID=189540 RepID=UPI0007A45FEF|nr:hypothetical protein [Nocardia pseudovaccinii]
MKQPALETETATDTTDSDSKAEDSAVDEEAAPPFRRRPWVPRAAVGAIAAVTVSASVLAGILGWKLHDRDEVDAAARQAATTAQNYAITLTSIDSQHIDQNFAAVLSGATGEFKDTYTQSSNQLETLLVQNNAVSKGKVVGFSIKSATKDRVEVMLFVDQEVTNSVSPDPRIDRSRMVMTMQRVGDSWLASKVELV